MGSVGCVSDSVDLEHGWLSPLSTKRPILDSALEIWKLQPLLDDFSHLSVARIECFVCV